MHSAPAASAWHVNLISTVIVVVAVYRLVMWTELIGARPRNTCTVSGVYSDCTSRCDASTSSWHNINLNEALCDSLESATVVNQSLVTDLTIQQPGFDLPRRTWCALNCFHTGQGLCVANLHKWSLASSDKCDVGRSPDNVTQTSVQ